MDDQKKMNRREFIRHVSAAGVGLAAGPAILGMSARRSSAQAGMSKLVIANHPDAVKGVQVNAAIAREMVDTGIIQFTGQQTRGAACCRTCRQMIWLL